MIYIIALIIVLILVYYMIVDIEKVYDRVVTWESSKRQTIQIQDNKPLDGFNWAFLIPFRRAQLWAAII